MISFISKFLGRRFSFKEIDFVWFFSMAWISFSTFILCLTIKRPEAYSSSVRETAMFLFIAGLFAAHICSQSDE